jgi:hypothetical protein
MVEIKITSVHEGNGQQFSVAPAGVITDIWNSAADGYTRVNLGNVTELTPPKDVTIGNGKPSEQENE